MAAPEPPNFNRYTGLDANVPVIPPNNQTITYPSDLSTIQTINGVSYGVQITAYKYSSGFYRVLQRNVANLEIGGLVGLQILSGLLTPEQEQELGRRINQRLGQLEQNILGNPLGTVNLQLPVKINDAHTLAWSQESAKAIFDFAGLVRIADVIASPAGVTINPALFMMFHHPNFKTIDMSWKFAAHNEQESFAIANIINFFKYHSSPERTPSGALLNYPSMFIIKLFPNDRFTFRIKPCIIESVGTDFTPAGYPSFNKNGTPVSINMGIRFKEIDIWTKDNWATIA